MVCLVSVGKDAHRMLTGIPSGKGQRDCRIGEQAGFKISPYTPLDCSNCSHEIFQKLDLTLKNLNFLEEKILI